MKSGKDSARDGNSRGIREFVEDLGKICRRADASIGSGRRGFELLTEKEQAHLLHRLSWLERWARDQRRRLIVDSGKVATLTGKNNHSG